MGDPMPDAPETLQAAVARDLAGLATLEPADAGRVVVLWLDAGLTEADAIAATTQVGVSVTPLSRFYGEPRAAATGVRRDGLVLG